MKSKFSAKDILVPTISLFLIALVATFLLAVVNNLTVDKIAEQTAKQEAAARETVFADASSFEEKDGYYTAVNADGKVIGYVFNTACKGYGGDVPVTVGIDTDGAITGIVPGDVSNETPGLGQNALKDSFKKQFAGLNGEITVVKNAANADNNEIQALTSATITSKAVAGAVNLAFEQYAEVTGGAK
ncbi:MAG: FMN-binding protein [Clostridia bacterium]|nr:FMN-binding protein [Clostridia bacterium]